MVQGGERRPADGKVDVGRDDGLVVELRAATELHLGEALPALGAWEGQIVAADKGKHEWMVQ